MEEIGGYQISSITRQVCNPAIVAWSVERLLHKKCHLLVVDRILVGMYMYILPPVSQPVQQVPLVHHIFRETVFRIKNGGERVGLIQG